MYHCEVLIWKQTFSLGLPLSLCQECVSRFTFVTAKFSQGVAIMRHNSNCIGKWFTTSSCRVAFSLCFVGERGKVNGKVFHVVMKENSGSRCMPLLAHVLSTFPLICANQSKLRKKHEFKDMTNGILGRMGFLSWSAITCPDIHLL